MLTAQRAEQLPEHPHGQLPDQVRDDHVSPEAGYTLVEVVIALVLAGIIILGGAAVVITGVDRTAAVQMQQTAPLVANQAMELARAVSPTGTPQVLTGLVQGRSSADVANQWLGAGAPGLSDSWQLSDPGAGAGGAGPVIPLQTSVQVGSSAYTVTTFIGACDLARSGGACTTTAAGLGAAPAQGFLRMVRVVVEVSWPATAASSCTGARCSYSTSALIDPHGDLLWNASPLGNAA